MEELSQLVSAAATQLLVKVSYFDCGGISVGVCFSHKIGDTSSFVAFMNARAAACQIIHPSFDLGLRFPPMDDDSSLTSGFGGIITSRKIAARRLVFEREKLEKLRRSHDQKQYPICSRVEAVSAFILH